MTAAGYNVVYKGKWHCSASRHGATAVPVGPRKVRLHALEPAGRRRQPERARGGRRHHRQRRPLHGLGRRRRRRATRARSQYLELDRGAAAAVLHGRSRWSTRTTSSSTRARPSPKPATTTPGSRATSACRRPTTKTSRPSPRCRKSSCSIFNLTGKPRKPKQKRNYLNFYGNLMRSSDNYLVNVLDKLEETGLLRRHADHPHRRPRRDGPHPRRPAAEELQLLRGGDRGSRSSTRTRSCSRSRPQTDALVSHVDFLPTLASLAAAPQARARATGRGSTTPSWSSARAPNAGPGLRRLHLRRLPVRPDEAAPTRNRRNHIVSIREGALEAGQVLRRRRARHRPQWEMYDLKTDPLEQTTSPTAGHKRTPAQDAVQAPETQARPGRKDPAATPRLVRFSASRGALNL